MRAISRIACGLVLTGLFSSCRTGGDYWIDRHDLQALRGISDKTLRDRAFPALRAQTGQPVYLRANSIVAIRPVGSPNRVRVRAERINSLITGGVVVGAFGTALMTLGIAFLADSSGTTCVLGTPLCDRISGEWDAGPYLVALGAALFSAGGVMTFAGALRHPPEVVPMVDYVDERK